jgi:hypothetical protein
MLRRTLLYGLWTIPPALRAADRGGALRIDPRAARKLEPAIFSTATMQNLANVRPESPVLERLLGAIRPPVLRLPGGNSMNLWDWNAGAVRTAEELHKFGEDPAGKMPKASGGNSHDHAAYFAKMGGPMVAERWAKLARQGGSEPLWGLNVSTAAPEETRTFVQHLKSAHLPARLFELGNELYLSENWGKQVPTVQDYIRMAKAHAHEVKAVFPNAKVAVCVNANDDRTNGPLAKAAPDKFKPAPLSEWNAGLRQETFYDDVVIHLYFRPTELGKMDGVSADDFVRWAVVRSSAFSVGEILDWTGQTFPKRRIWATEWNLNNAKHGRAKTFPYLPEHTILSGLFDASFLLNAASVPSNLTIANYWQLNGGGDFGLISDAPFRERPAFHVFRMLSPVIHECDRIAALDVPGAPRVRGPRQFEVMEAPSVTAFAFFKGDKLRYLAGINFTNEKFPLRCAGAKARLECLTAAEVLPSWNNPKNPKPGEWAPKYDVTQADVGLQSLSLEARSFSVIKV